MEYTTMSKKANNERKESNFGLNENQKLFFGDDSHRYVYRPINYPESNSQDLQRPPTPVQLTPELLESIAPTVPPPVAQVRKKISATKNKAFKKANLVISPDQFQPVKPQRTDFYNIPKFTEHVKPVNNRPPADLIYKCTPGFIQGVGTATGNQYFKILTCGQEWCPQCGDIHSHTHERRILRLFDNLMKMHSLNNSTGYLVVTIPAGLRPKFLDKTALNDFRNYWRRKLKREGYQVGIIRYHWAGEDGTNWKPHLNILLPQKFIERSILERWRQELAIWFQNYCEIDKPTAPNIWYQYTRDVKKAKFWLRYVTRATMRTYHQHASPIIKGFRNTAPFGQFKKIQLDVEAITIESQIIKGRDVDETTGEIGTIVWLKKYNANKMKWQPDLLPVKEFKKLKTEILSAGFWKLKSDIPNLPEKLKLCGHLSQSEPDYYSSQAPPEARKQSKLIHRAPPPGF